MALDVNFYFKNEISKVFIIWVVPFQELLGI